MSRKRILEGEKVLIAFHLPVADDIRLRIEAAHRRVSKSQLLRDAVALWLARNSESKNEAINDKS